MSNYNAIDLFCGAGGFSEGILQAGFHILLSSDINETVKETYIKRHAQLGIIEGIDSVFIQDDIRNINGARIRAELKEIGHHKNDIDVFFGGPPCQGFSRAGKRDPDDPRNLLFREYLRLVDEVKPKYVVMENVEGFMDTKLKDYIGVTNKLYEGDFLLPEILISEFKEIQYRTLEPKVLNAADYGVPQNRRRAIFIAYRQGQAKPKYPSISTQKPITVFEALADLYDLPPSQYAIDRRDGVLATKDCSRNEVGIKNFEFSRHSKEVIERFSLFRNGETTSQLKQRILSEGINLSDKPELIATVSNKVDIPKPEIINIFQNGEPSKKLIDAVLTKKSNRIKLDPCKAANTILTLPDDYISPFSNKAITVREMARLQSFDDSFVFYGKKSTGGVKRRVEIPQFTQVGNAVPPLLARAIAEEIRLALSK